MFHSISNIFLTTFFISNVFAAANAQHIPFNTNETLTWQQTIAAFDSLDRGNEIACLFEMGNTDIGKPLHLFIINKDKIFYPELFNRKKNILLINNAIHPGEPDGVDASLMFCRELLNSNSSISSMLDSTIICIIPMYNVDGALNRNANSRANQNGPAQYGFRGNARNLDLNRDFIKCDSKNAMSFNQLFARIRPHVFVDTHVSNGADYPYTMTLISTQSNKLGGALGKFLKEKMEPTLFASMKKKDHEMCPYVNTMGHTPESGLFEFLETPRFSSGYAALFNCIGFVTETHMLKPFAQRVESTYQFFASLLFYMEENALALNNLKIFADNEWVKKKSVYLNYELDTTAKNTFHFNGYMAESKISEVGSGTRLFYNHNAPWSKDISFYQKYKGTDEVKVPLHYILPQAWSEAAERLKWNGVSMSTLKNDTTIKVSVYYIDDFETNDHPYEGHYLHSAIKLRSEIQGIQFFAGDYIIPTNQNSIRYITTVLEPQCADSFFAWNFFDAVLQQKEWFSDYVFEDIAANLLATDSELKKMFDLALVNDKSLQNNHWNQLYWIYKHSPYYEKSAYRYPVYRLE